MAATTITLTTGATRTVKGAAADIALVLKGRTLTADDGLRTFIATDGEEITINRAAVVMAEAAEAAATTKGAFGFAQALETA